MRSLIRHFAPLGVGLISLLALTARGYGATLDTDLVTGYSFYNNYEGLTYQVCGSLAQASGCIGGGNVGPFGHIGAILEGYPSYTSDTVVRGVYVVDVAGGVSGDQVVIYRYVETMTFYGTEHAGVQMKLAESAVLPLAGGSGVRCMMAANLGFVFVATNQSTNIARVKKVSLEVKSIPSNQQLNVTDVTTNAYGYVMVTLGGSTDPLRSNLLFDPEGEEISYGGAQYVLSTSIGISTDDIPTTAKAPATGN